MRKLQSRDREGYLGLVYGMCNELAGNTSQPPHPVPAWFRSRRRRNFRNGAVVLSHSGAKGRDLETGNVNTLPQDYALSGSPMHR